MSFPGETKRSVLIVAELEGEGKILGSVSVSFGKNQHHASFSRLFVDPSYRQKGIGRTLLGHASIIAKNGGALNLTAYVNQTNDHAMAFYLHEGFQVIYEFQDGDHLIWRSV